ncbi:MAG: SAM-dependent chlorinase/fluorinase [Chloracidobacterium sp.]|nr:SAM-dependent chlorinase/fluorinase [Chloracidobacterium sp.]
MITLLTDFGLSDYFVPAVKGVILTINPEVTIVDITHDMAAHDIQAAAFTLGACYRDFPSETVHVVVVDPGVGSPRRAIIASAGGYFFVGPDNGVFSFVYDRESNPRIFHITNDQYFRHPVSATFHGRDVFAPVAAHIASGIKPEEIGVEVDDYVRFEIPRPHAELIESKGMIEGRIIHIDHFGNLVTNFTEAELKPDRIAPSTKMHIGGREVGRFNAYFAEADAPGRDDLFAYRGSAGFWEIALWRRSAAELIHARRGDEVILDLGI